MLVGWTLSFCVNAKGYSIPGLEISNLYYWVPPEDKNQTPQQALEQAQWVETDDELNFGYAYRTLWVKQDVRSYRAGDWVLHINYPLIDYIDIYLYKGDQLIEAVFSGDRRSMKNKPVKVPDYVLGFRSDEGSSYRLLVRLETEGTMMMPISWRTQVEYAEFLSMNQSIYGAYYGILIIMALYHLFIFLVVRERGYLFYCLSVSAFVFLQLTFDGRGFAWLWPELPDVNRFSFPFAYTVYQLAVFTFMAEFLQLSKSSPKLHWYFLGLRGLVLINMILIFIVPYATIMPVIVVVGMTGIVSGLLSGAYLWSKGFVAARYFTGAWALFLGGILLLNLRGLGIGETNWISQYGYLIGSVLEVLFLAFSLADRISTTNKEKRKAEKALIESQKENLNILKRYQELYENAPIGNFQSNNKYQLLSVNQACAHLFGFEKPADMLAHVKDIRAYLKSDFEEFQTMVKQTRRQGRVHDQEIQIEDHLGRSRWLSISMRHTKESGSQGYEGSIQDVTERKMSEELQRALDQERMQIMEKFSLGIAKEINTPLGSNVATAAFIRETLDDLKEAEATATVEDYQRTLDVGIQSLGLLESNQRRITRVVKRFREVSSQHLGLQESHFCLLDVINEAVENYRWKMAGWRVHVVCSPDIKLYSYPKAIALIITQLIDNALSHSYADQGQDPKIWIRVEDDHQGNAVLTFTDNGKGIKKEMVKNLCQPFFTTKRGPEGHIGLGLYMIYNLVNRSLNGRLYFPITGKGFCVQINMALDITDQV